MYTLGINAVCHDCSSCMVRDALASDVSTLLDALAIGAFQLEKNRSSA